MKKLLIITIFLIATAFQLPGMSKNSTLVDSLKRVQESEIENSRDPKGSRPASLNKKPWMADNINDMESLAWPDFGGRNNLDSRLIPPNADGTRDWGKVPQGGCAFYQPNITDNCNEPYEVRMGILRGVVVDVAVTGDTNGFEAFKPENGPLVVTVYPFANAPTGSRIKVEAWTKSLKAGEESDGYCSTNVLLLCEDECECLGHIPTITASNNEIAAGGSITLSVDSGGVACPPYTWSTSSNGYSISPSTTSKELETVTLSCASGSCGAAYDVYATITVTDNCGVSDEIVIRNTAGTWDTGTCILGACGTIPTYTYEGSAIGKYKYIIGTKTGTKPWTECVEPDSVTLLASYTSWGFDSDLVECIAPGYVYVDGRIIRLFLVTRYEWSCPP